MSSRHLVLLFLLAVVAGCGSGDRTSQAPALPAPPVQDGAAPPPPPPPPAPGAPAPDPSVPEVADEEPEMAVPPGDDAPEDAPVVGPESETNGAALEFPDERMDQPAELEAPAEAPTLFSRARQTLIEGRFPEGLALLQAAALAEEEAAEEALNTLRWSPALKRPMLATRWGIVVLTGGLPGGALAGGPPGNPEMGHAAGEGAAAGAAGAAGVMVFWHHAVGLPLVQGLEARVSEGAFGHWLRGEALQAQGAARPLAHAPHADPPQFDEFGEGAAAMAAPTRNGQQVRGMLATLAATLGDAKRWAADHQLDVLMTISVTPGSAVLRGRLQTNFAVKLYDVAKDEELWSSRSLGSRRVEAALADTRSKDDPAQDFVNDVLNYIDQNLRLTDMPQLDSKVVARRAAALAAGRHDDPLPALVELRYYVAKGLLDASTLREHFTTILGRQDGAELASGNLEQRRRVVEALLR